MKITVAEGGTLQLEEGYNPIILTTRDGEDMIISMRDSGFEFTYQGRRYYAKEGEVNSFNKEVKPPYLQWWDNHKFLVQQELASMYFNLNYLELTNKEIEEIYKKETNA